MKPAEYKLKISELLSYMRKTMSTNRYTGSVEVIGAASERLPQEATKVLQALKDLGLLEVRIMEVGEGENAFYYRLSDSFHKATPHVVMRQLGMIKGTEPKITQKERIACLPDSGEAPQIEYVVRMGEVLYSEPVKGLDNARDKARELMNIHSQTSATLFRVDRVIEISSLF